MLAPRHLRRLAYSLALLLITLGGVLRFTYLDSKGYWIDEVYTSLRVAGYSEMEVIDTVFEGQPISRNELLAYQKTSATRGVQDTIRSLALENQHHPPGYYVLLHFWNRVFGSSITATRAFSAIAGVLVIPAIYWLGRELYGSVIFGAIAASLIAISPLHFIYAQEARAYSLWTVLILVSSAAFLRAYRLKTDGRWWSLYAVSMAAGYYTALFHIFVAIAHTIYIGLIEKGRLTPRLKAFGLSFGGSLLLFLPWIAMLASNLGLVRDRTAWIYQGAPLLQKWLTNLGDLFFDLNFGSRFLLPHHVLAWILVCGSFYWVCKRAAPSVGIFLMTLAGVNALGLMLPDLILGGQRSVHERYLFPAYVVVTLVVAFLIGEHLIQPGRKRWSVGIAMSLWILLAIAGLSSISTNLQAETWWNKSPDKHGQNPVIASIVNETESPLLIADDSEEISECYACRIITLSYRLDEKVTLQLVTQPHIPDIPVGFSDVFVFSPTESLLAGLASRYSLQTVFEQDAFKLYRLAEPL